MLSAKSLFLLTAVLSLSACGFQPVYATKDYRLSNPPSGSASITADLALVRLLPVKESIDSSLQQSSGRGGQKLQNLLIDRMYPQGYPQQPRYTLDVNLASTETQLGIQKDATATRAELQMNAELFLRPVTAADQVVAPEPADSSKAGRNKLRVVNQTADGRPTTSFSATVYHTTIRTRVSYNILTAQYGTLVARENAIDRGLEQVADEIVNRLSLYYSRDPEAAKQADLQGTTLPPDTVGSGTSAAPATDSGSNRDTLTPAATPTAATTAPANAPLSTQ